MAFNPKFPDSDIPEGLTRKQIVNYARLRGSRLSLDKQYGENKWGVPEIIERLQGKAQVVKEASEVRLKDEEKRYRAYTESFENITPNDEHNFRMLVAIEIRMEAIEEDLKRPKEGQRIKDLSDSFKALSTEHRQLEVALGIGRATRGDQINIATELENFKQAAAELIKKSGTTIRCSNCKSQFNFGFIVFHFQNDVPWKFDFECPKCRHLSTQSGTLEFSDIPFEIPNLETALETQA
jgi:hypothetical protein